MADSAVGSIIFTLVALLSISLLVLLLIRFYLPLRSTPGYLLFPVFLGLALPCSIILLVPIDLASAEPDSSRGIWLPERAVLVAWRITYWLTFLLTWWLLPLLGEYVDSGFRDLKSRILYSLRNNARYQLIVLGTGIAGLVYYILQNGFNISSIKGMIMALAYAYGLLLAIGLMGHGLVALPRRLFRTARPSGKLRSLQTQAPKTKDNMEEAVEQLEELENTVIQLKQRKSGTGRVLQEWIDELADTTATPVPRNGAAAAIGAAGAKIPAVITESYLAELTRKLKRAKHKEARFVDEWNNICRQAQDAQTVLDSASSKSLDFGSGRETFMDRLSFITPTMRYQLYANVMPGARVAISACLALASIMVIWSEIVRSFAPQVSLINLTVVHHPNSDEGKVGLAGQVIAAAWLLYMDACALYAMTDMKVWGNRALVKRQTYAESACWYSLQVAKLTVPLSYNFITMLRADVYKETSFYKFLGQLINLTPLGKGFSAFFPIFLLLPVLATAFNLYGKAKNIFGFGILEDETEGNPSGFGTGGWREGKALIERELQSRSAGGAAVGLLARGGSLDLERQAGGTSTPPERARAQREALSSGHTQEANRQFNSITNQEEPADDRARHFYQDFFERVGNTFDSVDRPEWVRSLGSGVSAPKWMQRDQGNEGSSGPASTLSRWFGGSGAGDGRLRI
ncbi:hypothetical protein LTR09_003580 [Extremus antarcticus]|uniref:Uncharacterized protein n=1 Tax=Extremus antarcticus TaxID=702011 RepID=A0AAJ0DK45_9PEZI|nr:hypothetical protein LTR09_003580 [Extremus antarcticus]